jgi:hypothetical protein
MSNLPKGVRETRKKWIIRELKNRGQKVIDVSKIKPQEDWNANGENTIAGKCRCGGVSVISNLILVYSDGGLRNSALCVSCGKIVLSGSKFYWGRLKE